MLTLSSSVPSDIPGCVTVFGAAGFIGRFVVGELLQRGWQVRAFMRPSEENPFAGQPNVEIIRGDVCDAPAVHRALCGSAAAINLAGAKSDEPESEAVNVGGPRHIVEAAHALGGGIRLVHFSTQAVKISRQGIYARTKLAGDRVFENSGLPFTILRPSVVYGPGRSGVFSTMQDFIERLPVIPVLGDGRWVSAPVHVTDVAHAVVACLATPVTIGRCYDLAGPDSLSFDQLLDRIASTCGRRCRKIHLPFRVALFAAQVASRLLTRSPVSVSNVLGSNQEIPLDIGPAQRDFGYQPISLEAGLRRMMAARERDRLLDEARLFGRHLLDVDVDVELQERYAAATGKLFAGAIDDDLAFVRRHRWSLPLLDAATAVIRPRSQVRQRLLLMVALLETSPQHADFFLASPPRPVSLMLGLTWRGLTSAVKLLTGALLLPFVRSHVAGR